MSQNKRLILLLICISVFLASCKEEIRDSNIQKKDTKQINIEVQNSEKIDKEQLQVLAEGINGVFNPLFAMSEGDKAVSYSMFMPFMGLKRKMETDPQNSIVSSMSREGHSLEFALDEDLNWWDGTPVTSHDVYFSLRVLLNKNYVGDKRRAELFYIKGAKDYYYGLTNEISGVKIIDDKHIRINFEDFQDSFYYAFDFRPIPMHYYQRANIKDIYSLNEVPMGNSAFKISSWEKNNFANLIRVQGFNYDTNLKYISIREMDKDNTLTEMLRGNLDAISYHTESDFLNQSEIINNFNNETVVENETVILRIATHNSFREIENRKNILNLVSEYNENSNIKFTNSLISPTNKAFTELNSDSFEKIAEKRSTPINLVYENRNYIKDIANDLKNILSQSGYVVTLNGASRYNIMATTERLINNGRNVIVLSAFKHGYMPDFSKEFSTLGDGRILFNDSELDQEIFDTIVDKKSDLKNAYKLLLNDIYNKKLAVGIGSPIVKTYYKKGLKNFINTEFRDWYEFATWDIIWQ